MKRVLLGLVAALTFAAPAQAADYIVTGLGDDAGTCGVTNNCTTLRAALTATNAAADADGIIIPAGQIQITSGPLQITNPVTITGPGPNSTTITGGAGGRVLEILNATASINDLTLQGGSAPTGAGGALMAEGSTVTLTRTRVTGGSAFSGGGVANLHGTMTINESLIDNNQATGIGAEGGGVVNVGDGLGAASMTINDSTIAFNTAPLAGGVSSYGNTGNTLTTRGVTIAKNQAGAGGTGGVRIAGGTWSAQFTLVSDNFQDPQVVSNCTGTDASSNGWNVENFEECGFTQEVDRDNVGDARLDTVLNTNGGPTLTMKLLDGSPALDIRTVGCTGVDQRGVARPQGAGCDAGAFESALAPSVPPTITAPAPDTYTSASELQFTGTATPGALIEVYLGTAGVASTEANAQGAWSATVDLPATDGEYEYGVSADGSSRTTVRVIVDRTAPTGTITSGPPAATNRAEVAFTYSKNDPDSTFRCRLVGPGRDDNEDLCPEAGQSYAGLAAGGFEFRLRTVDRAGNDDTDVYSFTIDPALVAAPEVADPATEPTAATLTFATAQAGRTLTCRLEGPGRDATFGACASPQRYDGLAAGVYRFTVRSTDGFGNFADSPAREFTIAGEPPVVVQQTAAPTPTPRPTETPTPQPDVGKTVVIRPTGGRVLIKLFGSSQFVEVKSLEEIPLGATIDTKNGRIQLRFETEEGKVQIATFYGGIFQVSQVGKILDLKLTEALAACPKQGKAAAAQTKAKKRKLWGDGKGAFRTTGKYSAATVRGTKWLVEDSCAGTLTRVTSGVVAVRAGKKTVLVRAGKKYLAKPR